MKIFILTLLGSLSILHAEDFSLELPTRQIEPPRISITDGAGQAPGPIVISRPVSLSSAPAMIPERQFEEKIVSKMPIIVPARDMDEKILKEPDSSVDFTLVIKAPDASAK